MEPRRNYLNEEDLADLMAARDRVVDALNHLAKVEDRTRAAENETIKYFVSGLRDWLSNDHGEAGFVPYAKKALTRVRK